jgi:uncharacterized protein (DUF1800 family)
MGDENTVLGPAEARHLLRRTGFGALPRDVDRILANAETRGQAVDQLLATPAKRIKPNGRDFQAGHNKWIKGLVKTRSPLQAKLALFWHDHFATASSKVQDVDLMSDHIVLLQTHAQGNLKEFVKEIGRNPAMMWFLDTVRNDKEVPNENYARELQELFTLGVYDFAGNPNYTQEDIVQIARAFTGWRYRKGDVVLDSGEHDYAADFPERGPKVIYRSSGGFGAGGRSFTANGEGAAEIDTVVDIIFQHRDSDGKNTVARRTARRLLEFFAHPDPANAVVDAVVAASGFDTTFEISGLLRAIFVDDAFYASMAPAPFGASTKKSVKWPVDYVVATLRVLGVSLKGRDLHVEGGSYLGIIDHLNNMGQLVLDPPSVFGWEWEAGWVSSATLLARYGFARDVASARGRGSRALRTERLIDLGLTDAGAIVDAVTDVLGVTDQLTPAERAALVDYLTDHGAHPSLDLNDYDVRNTKLNGLFALVLQSPAYQLH